MTSIPVKNEPEWDTGYCSVTANNSGFDPTFSLDNDSQAYDVSGVFMNDTHNTFGQPLYYSVSELENMGSYSNSPVPVPMPNQLPPVSTFMNIKQEHSTESDWSQLAVNQSQQIQHPMHYGNNVNVHSDSYLSTPSLSIPNGQQQQSIQFVNVNFINQQPLLANTSMNQHQLQVKQEPMTLSQPINISFVKQDPSAVNEIPIAPVSKSSKKKQSKLDANGQVKVRKKIDRFHGVSEEEVMKKVLPDHLADKMDILLIGINPGLFAAYKGHHYAGPGNHFWKCLFLSGLVSEPWTSLEDWKLPEVGIGLTNMVQRTTRGSADLTRKEIKEGSQYLVEKCIKYNPPIAAFNGKCIYEIFCASMFGKFDKSFQFGRQPHFMPGTKSIIYVMPSSSARCSQFPRAQDKVPYYEDLKSIRDQLKTGELTPELYIERTTIALQERLASKQAKRDVELNHPLRNYSNPMVPAVKQEDLSQSFTYP